MREYQGDPIEDHLLLQWYARMAQAGELDTTLGPVHRALHTFFATFQPPCKLLYETDGEFGIYVACWYDPSPMQGAFFALWVAPEYRTFQQPVNVIRAIASALNVGFVEYELPVVLVATKDPKLADQYARFGFVKMGEVPHLYGGETAHVLYLTAEAFVEVRRRYLEAA